MGAKESPEAVDTPAPPQRRSLALCLLEALGVRLKPDMSANLCHKGNVDVGI